MQVLRMYDVGDKLLNAITSMYVNSLAYVRVKVGSILDEGREIAWPLVCRCLGFVW